MKHIVGNIIKRKIIDETIEKIDEEDDTNLLCLSLFEAAAHYLVEYKIGTLKRLRPQHIDGFIITARPPNLIHESVKKAIRREEDYGKNLQGFAKEIFKYISVIKEADLERHGIDLNFIRNGKIQQTCRHLQNRCQEKVKVAVTPFLDCLEFRFGSHIDNWPEPSQTPFWFEKISNPGEAKKWLRNKVLIPCRENNVDILVLPELTVDKVLLEYLKKWLKENNREPAADGYAGLLMTVAGSFHFKKKNGERFNTSTVLNHAGEVLWCQDKLEMFSLDDHDIKKKPQIPQLLKISPNGGYERITCSHTVSIVDTPLGRLVVSICIDFFHHVEAYRSTGANVFLVPAMTYQTIRLVKAAEFLAERNLAASFLANSAWAAKKDKNEIHENGLSFYILPEVTRKSTLAEKKNGELLIYEFKKLTNS
jgi:predicted amidohydrolase